MKREELKSMGLTDEQVDKVMAENGKDIEAHKTKAATAETALKAANDQLTEANKQIEAFKGMDIEGVKKTADEWKAKAEKAQTDAAAQIATLKFEHALDGALTNAKARNLKAVKALLDVNLLKLNDADGSIVGLEDQLKKLKTDAEYLFESETTPAKPLGTPPGRQPAPGNKPTKPDGIPVQRVSY